MKRLLLVLFLVPFSIEAQYVARPSSGSGASTSAANSWTALQTFTLGDKITGGTSGGTANASTNYLYFAPPSAGAYQLMRFGNNEAATADFGAVLTQSAGSNGETRQDNQYSWGYNIGTGGRFNSSEHAFWESIENRYKTGTGIIQLEQYYTYQNAAGTSVRPFSMTINLTTDSINAAIRANDFIVGFNDTAYDWLDFTSTASSGSMAMTRNSSIDYAGTKTDYITAGGTPALGLSGSTGRLFSGLATAEFFSSASAGTAFSLGFNTGSAVSLKWDGTNGWQFSTSSSTWQKMGLPSGFYIATSPLAIGVGPTSFSNTGSSLVEIYDATASTGRTQLRIRAGAGQNINLLDVANSSDTSLWKVDSGGTMYGTYFREAADMFALQSGFDSTNVLIFGSGKKIAWNAASTFAGGANDTFIERGTAKVVKLTSAVNLPAVTFANAVASPAEGTIQAFTDSSTVTWGATITGSGANHVLGYYDGTNWTVMGK